MNDFLKKILALGAEIEKADSAVEIDMAINDAEIAYEKHLEQLAISRVGKCNCDKESQDEEEYDIQHLINDTYQVVGKETGTVWKQGTVEECNDWVML